MTRTLTARQKVLDCLQQREPGALVRYQDFAGLGVAPGTVAVVLSRLRREGTVQQLTKGVYRRPLTGRFGPVPASEQQVLQALLQTPGEQLRGYPTGVAAFNRLGLTTQVPQQIEIATLRPGRPRKVGNVQLRFVQSCGEVKMADVGLRQLLDALRRLKRLPDTAPGAALPRLREQIGKLKPPQKAQLTELAASYNPATRALLGAVLEQLGENQLATQLQNSLNPLTTYKIGLSALILPNRAKWRIQ
jgi:hypothetical protein